MAGSTLITKDDEAHMLGPILSIAWYGKGGGAHWACNAIEVGIISLHSSPTHGGPNGERKNCTRICTSMAN